MVFISPSAARFRLSDIPDSIPIAEFLLNEQWGRQPIRHSRKPFVCGLTGKSYSVEEVKQRTDDLARGLAEAVDWSVRNQYGQGEWSRVAGILSFNSIDAMIVSWAIHRLNGISSPINAAFSASEVAHQLQSSKAEAFFTCRALLPIALAAARKAGIPERHIFLIKLPGDDISANLHPKLYTIENLIVHGMNAPELPNLQWRKGQGARQEAFLCYSSGTSGLPKGVMISHRNVIANILQITANERQMRKCNAETDEQEPTTETALCTLPQSHIYGLVYICQLAVYRGDQIVVLPKFDFRQALRCIDKYWINTLFLVPPIIVRMVKNHDICQQYDLTAVCSIITGAAPLGAETAAEIGRLYPNWHIRQGYGLTETATVVSSTLPHDIWHGSSGMLIPGFEARILGANGEEVREYGREGELLLKSPSVVLGYSNNPAANKETFSEDGWLRTGDVAMFRVSQAGNEHLWILDRAKDLIKVKGHQVAPAELEAHLLTHPDVEDCAVIPIPDERAGELPKAFIKAKGPDPGPQLARDISQHIQQQKARFKWLAGGVEFVNEIPKSPTGKILRRLLRDQEMKRTRATTSKL